MLLSKLRFASQVLAQREMSQTFCECGGVPVLVRVLVAASGPDAAVAEAAHKLFVQLGQAAVKSTWLALAQLTGQASEVDASLVWQVKVGGGLWPGRCAGARPTG